MAGQAQDMAVDQLINKVQQHEKTIAQLIEMIAAMNCRISELALKQKEEAQSRLPS